MNKNKKGADILELYDGQMATANKKLITDIVSELKISAYGKELFAISESFYCKWLSGEGDKSYIDRAVELCKRAVEEGYPHAVAKMGFYYDKDYVAPDRTEEFRCRVACDYYCKIIYSDAPPRVTDVGAVAEIGWDELRKMTAHMLLDMLSCAPASLSDYGNGKYQYARNAQRIFERFGISHSAQIRPQRAERDRVKFAETVFLSCKHNMFRAPLFGIICLSGAEAKQLLSPKSETMQLVGSLNLWVYAGGKVERANNTTRFTSYVDGISDSTVWLFFFNNEMGGHRHLTPAQMNTLSDLMSADGFMRFFRLKDSADVRGRTEYLFSDDDVYFFMASVLTPLKSALDSLIEFVVSDKEWSNL